VKPERTLLLSSYLNSPTVGRCLSVYDLSSLMCCIILGFGYPVLYLHLFKASLLFSPLVFALLLSGLSSLFMPERIGLRQAIR
jgi:hypothetical protein